MLQRIQTVFLFLIVALMVAFFFFPVWVGTSTDGTEMHQFFNLFYFQVSGEVEQVIYSPHGLSGILSALAIVIAFIEIFSYKNRLTQSKLGALNALLLAGTLISALWFATQTIDSLEGVSGSYGIGVFFPVGALICNMLANHFIRKDEKLVRSMDRIR